MGSKTCLKSRKIKGNEVTHAQWAKIIADVWMN